MSAAASTKPATSPKRLSIGKILLTIAGVVLGLIAVFLIVAAMQPDDYKVSRSTTIDAPPEVVFAQINDFHKWESWSPWLADDPDAKGTYEGPDSGKGAKFSWDGNAKVGQGSMTIVDSQPPERLHIKLEFIKPMEGVSDVFFTLKPEESGTHIHWEMSGKQNGLIGKAMCLVMNMDQMVGGYYEKGLAKIKEISEKEAKSAAPEKKVDGDNKG